MIPNPLPDTASALFVRRLHLQAKIGDLGTSDMLAHKKSMVNEDPQAIQRDQITLAAGFLIGKAYTISILGLTITYTTVAGDIDVDGVATSFAAALNANPDVRGQVESSALAGGLINVDGLIPGNAYTLNAGTNTTVAPVQSAVEASQIPFGRLVLFKGYSAVAHRAATELTRLATSAAFAAQQDAGDVVYDAASTYLVSIVTDGGYRADFAVAANASANQTATDIRTAINADLTLATEGITAGGAGATVELDSATIGYGFKSSTAISGGAGTLAIVSTYGVGVSLLAAAAGASMSTLDDEQLIRAGDLSVYRPNDPVKVLTGGTMWVELDAADTSPVFGAGVYVSLTAGATAGRFYMTPAAGRMKLAGLTWLRGANNGSDLIGEIKISLA